MSFTLSFPLPSRENQLGLLPITSSHWPCVTGWIAISNSALISVFLAEPFSLALLLVSATDTAGYDATRYANWIGLGKIMELLPAFLPSSWL
jgi:hypothetical protein